MNNIFKCPNCNKLIKCLIPDVCPNCGCHIKDENGIFIFTPKGNMEIDSENKYIGFDVIAPNYDSSRERSLDSKEGEIVGKLIGAGNVILEIGAGTGYHSIPMAKTGCKVIAGDISINMLHILISKMNDNLKENLLPCKMDSYSLPLADKSIDAVLIDHVFHLIENPEVVLNEIKRVVKPNGYFINILYSGQVLSSDEEVTRYQEINLKIAKYYESAIKRNDVKLLKRFGWIGQKDQQYNLNKLFPSCNVIEDDTLVKKQTITIKDELNNYRNRVHVNQAIVDREINNKIIDEIEDKLYDEFGKENVNRKFDTLEKTSIQLFTVI